MVYPWSWCHNLGANAVFLICLDRRPADEFAARAARTQHRELSSERHPLFGEQLTAELLDAREPIEGLSAVPHNSHTLTVVATNRSLDDGHAPASNKVIEFGGGAHRLPGWHRQTQLSQPPAHRKLVLRVNKRVRAGPYCHTLGLESL